MKRSLFSKVNPFKKKDPTQEIISTLTESLMSLFQKQINDNMTSAVAGITSEFNTDTKMKDDETEQNRIFAAAIQATNGNRDDVQRVPDVIEIKKFNGDKMPPEERQDAQEIIDIINEANEINRSGTYRTVDGPIETESENPAATVVSGILGSIAEFLAPVAKSIITCLGAVISIMVLNSMTKMLNRI